MNKTSYGVRDKILQETFLKSNFNILMPLILSNTYLEICLQKYLFIISIPNTKPAVSYQTIFIGSIIGRGENIYTR